MAGNMFSTKGRYALRAMADLATHDGWVSLGDVSKRQGISRKYLEQVIALMHKAGYVESQRGKGGGYRLSREPDAYTVWEILSYAEGDLSPVSCLGAEALPCSRAAECRTLPMWREYYELTKDYFSRITIADLMKTEIPDNYVL